MNCAALIDGGLCLPETSDAGAQTGWPGGYCTFACGSDPGVCGDGGVCAAIDTPGLTMDACAARCSIPGAGQMDCRAGYVCTNFVELLEDGGSSASPDAGICIPSCLDPGPGCKTGQVCDDAGYCR